MAGERSQRLSSVCYITRTFLGSTGASRYDSDKGLEINGCVDQYKEVP